MEVKVLLTWVILWVASGLVISASADYEDGDERPLHLVVSFFTWGYSTVGFFLTLLWMLWVA